MLLFFCKQKTAYELRISDWSSYVCSSDLVGHSNDRANPIARHFRSDPGALADPRTPGGDRGHLQWLRSDAGRSGRAAGRFCASCRTLPTAASCAPARPGRARRSAARSEEHTSELQSLMRISYAVFCLKKKTTNKNSTTED